MLCIYCESSNTIKRGHYGRYGQRYKCKSCKKTFSTGGTRIYFTYKEKNHIVKKSYGYGNLIRMCKTYRISPKTIYKRRKMVDRHNKKILNMMGYF